MKQSKRAMALLLSAALSASMLPMGALAAETLPSDSAISVSAEDSAVQSMVYGTMNIPYDAFYAAEGVDYDVDAVTTATTSKYKMNGDTGLVKGTYYVEKDEEGHGSILGVTYPVAISEEDLQKLQTDGNEYSFTQLDTVPDSYKTVSVDSDGSVAFSAVNSTQSAQSAPGVTAETISTNTNYGDYQIDLKGITYNGGTFRFDADATETAHTVYGVLVETSDGAVYAMRHLENIWRAFEIAWSAGFTTEVHGGTVSYENYESMMGKTISQISLVTEDGYYNVDTSLYVPIKFDGSVSAADAQLTAGSTTVTTTGLPSDYDAEYSVEGLDATVSGNTLTFPKTAKAGQYTLTVSDKGGKYADLTTTFVLSTESMPATYDESTGKLVLAEDCTEEDFENFISNISTVSANGTDYRSSGRGSVKIVDTDGTILTSASPFQKDGVTVNGKYELTVTSTGYQAMSFVLYLRGEQTITTAKTSYSAALGANSVSLGAVTSGDGALTYESSNPSVAAVAANGTVTYTGVGTAVITVRAAQTDAFYAGEKTVAVTVTCAAPSVIAAANSKSGIKVSWAKSEGASGYEIYRKTGSGSWKKVKTISGGSTTSWTSTGLKNGTKYTFRVKAVGAKSALNSKYSSSRTAYRLTGTSITVKNSGSKKLTVKWSKNSKATGYQIQYATDSSFQSVKTAVASAKSTSKTISRLSKNKTYSVRVRAYKTVSGKKYYSAWSSIKTVTIKK